MVVQDLRVAHFELFAGTLSVFAGATTFLPARFSVNICRHLLLFAGKIVPSCRHNTTFAGALR
jgi:hypothetical protein